MKKNVIKKVRAPKGFRLTVAKNCYDYWQVNLFKVDKSQRTLIGTIELQRDYGRTFSTHSNLEPEFHGRGLGTIMYAKAIEWCLLRGYRCKSYGWPSAEAKRVWRGQGLRKYFDIKERQTIRDSDENARTFYTSWKSKK